MSKRSNAIGPGNPLYDKLARQGRLPNLEQHRMSPDTSPLDCVNAHLLAEAIDAAKSKRRKMGNTPTCDSEGRIHPSKLQARVTDRLRAEGWTVICEVSMPLSERPKDRIRLDIVAVKIILGMPQLARPDHRIVRFIEVKGFDTPTGIQKRRRFFDKYKIEIEVIKS